MYGFVATLNVPFLLIILNHDTHITLDLLMQDESGDAYDRGQDDWYFLHGRSEVWKHFMKNTEKTKVMCSHCPRGKTICVARNSTGNMWQHLLLKHQIEKS